MKVLTGNVRTQIIHQGTRSWTPTVEPVHRSTRYVQVWLRVDDRKMQMQEFRTSTHCLLLLQRSIALVKCCPFDSKISIMDEPCLSDHDRSIEFSS